MTVALPTPGGRPAALLVNGERLLADPAGALVWPDRGVVAVADLHLEKGSSFARSGRLLPPYDSRATLARLAGVLARHDARLVVCLGDSFHDREAHARLGPDDRACLAGLMRGREWVWIAGNHDPGPPDGIGGATVAELRLGGLVLRHEPRAGGPAGEVAGHLHPKAAVRLSGRRIVRRCFIGDGVRLVVPSFGAYTGGLDVLAAPFRPLFPGPFHAWLLGSDAVHGFAAGRLVPV